MSVNEAYSDVRHLTGRSVQLITLIMLEKSSLLPMVMNIHSTLGNHKGMSFLNVVGAIGMTMS